MALENVLHFILSAWMFAYMYFCVPCASNALRGQKGTSDPFNWNYRWMVVNYCECWELNLDLLEE